VEEYVGLDVSQKTTVVCVVDAQGRRVWAGKCASTPEAIGATVRAKAPGATRVGLETGPLSTWLYHGLKALGVPVVCLDARHAKAALSMQINKSDRNDAEGLAQIVRTGWYREVHVKSEATHLVRTLLRTRLQLTDMRRDVSNQIRGSLKTFGVVLPKAGGRRFEQVAREAAEGRPELQAFVLPLLAAWRALGAEADALDRQLRERAKADPVCRLLATVPGVGAIIALTYAATIDDPARFRKSRNVGAHLGLTPRRTQSGEVDYQGAISRWGDAMARHYLFEAAGVLLTRVQRWSTLKAWGTRLAGRVGLTKAKVAVARKLSVILHRIWTTGEPFRWGSQAEAAV
jgi:transposase